jgi:hypothetical protein
MLNVFLNDVGIVLFYCLGWFSDLVMIGNSKLDILLIDILSLLLLSIQKED